MPPDAGEKSPTNIGTAGVGVFKSLLNSLYQFKKINAGSSYVTITDDTGNDELDVDVASTVTKNNTAQTFTSAHTFNSSTLKVRNPADTFSYTMVASAIAADRNLLLPLLTADDQIVTLDLGQTFTGIKTFNDGKLKVRNPADTFNYKFVASAIAADRDITLPLLTATDTITVNALAQTLTNKTLTTPALTTPTVNGQIDAQVAKTANYTLTATDKVIRCDASAGAFTITLPAASAIAGTRYWIIRTDSGSSTNILTIDANASETIDGLLTWILLPGEKLEIMSDGTNWVTLFSEDPSITGYFYVKNSTNNRRYVAGSIGNSPVVTTSTTTPAANTLWALPFIVGKTTKFDLISFEVTTLIAAKNARAGIYYDNGNCYPGALIFDTTSVSVASAGVKDTTITSSLQMFQPGLYWLAWETDSTVTLQIKCLTSGTPANGILGVTSSSGNAGYGYSVAHTYGALPNPYTAAATVLTTAPGVGNPIPAVSLRAI